jgi:hypothetical protein
MEEMWSGEIPLVSEDVSFDPNRDQLDRIRTVGSRGVLSPLAFLAGPVKVTYDSDEPDMIHPGLEELINGEAGTVRSITGEMNLDYMEGIFRFHSPKAAGVSGFIGGKGSIYLGPVTIISDNDYITVGVVSMDGLQLAESGKILIQSGTTYRPTGWKQVEEQFRRGRDTVEGYRIIDTGRMPWVAASTLASVSVTNLGLKKAVLLDLAGYPSRELDLKHRGDRVEVKLPNDALYAVLSAPR